MKPATEPVFNGLTWNAELYLKQLEAIAEVASRVHIAMAADSAEHEGPSSEQHSEYLIMNAEDELQVALKPWRERRLALNGGAGK